MMWRKSGLLKRSISTFLAFGMLCALAGCQNSRLRQPAFPLKENVIKNALKKTGLSGIISESETFSSVKGHIAYTLRDPEETYGDTENKVLIAGVSSAITEGERFLSVNFPSNPYEPVTTPFSWEDWKQQLVFATLLFGGFEDEEEVYRAFSVKETPMYEDRFKWDAQLQGGYIRVSYSMDTVLRTSFFTVTIYESKSLYQTLHQDRMEMKEELD